jgi:glutamate dehydrogenase/leucine dehydrogenase
LNIKSENRTTIEVQLILQGAKMPVTTEQKKELINKYGKNSSDTGTP